MNVRFLATALLIKVVCLNVSAEPVRRDQVPKDFKSAQQSPESHESFFSPTQKESVKGFFSSFPPQDYVEKVFSSMLSRGPEKQLNPELQKKRADLLAPANSFVGLLSAKLAAVAYGDREAHIEATEGAIHRVAAAVRSKLAQAGINPNRWPELLEHVACHIAKNNSDLVAQLAAYDPSTRAQAEQKLTALAFGWVKCGLKAGTMKGKECVGVGKVWENLGKTYAFLANGGAFDPLAPAQEEEIKPVPKPRTPKKTAPVA